MKYLRTFNQRLCELRKKKKLTKTDIAMFCQVDESVVTGWEAAANDQRSFPTIDQLLDLCVKTGVSLSELLDFRQPLSVSPQLDLLSFMETEQGDLNSVLIELGDAVDAALPDEQERDLLRRFRLCDDEKKEFILQLLPAEVLHKNL
jgi:transcriptional regulator with XRE-family HTH domain